MTQLVSTVPALHNFYCLTGPGASVWEWLRHSLSDTIQPGELFYKILFRVHQSLLSRRSYRTNTCIHSGARFLGGTRSLPWLIYKRRSIGISSGSVAGEMRIVIYQPQFQIKCSVRGWLTFRTKFSASRLYQIHRFPRISNVTVLKFETCGEHSLRSLKFN